MSIKEVRDSKGNVTFSVTVNLRCSTDRNVRIQKNKFGVKTMQEAKKEEVKLRRDAERELASRAVQGATWGALVERWDKYLSSGADGRIGRTSAIDYMCALRTYTKDWFTLPATSVTPFHVKKVLEQVEGQGKSNPRKRFLLSSINGLFKWALDQRLVPPQSVSPTYGIKVCRKADKKPEILTLEESRKFLETARAMQHDWYPIWAMAFLTGMRSGELFALHWTDIDWDNRILTVARSFSKRENRIKETKGGYWRDVPINDDLLSLLTSLKASCHTRRRGHDFVLPRIAAWDRGEAALATRTFLKGIGMRDVKFHTLRACFATQLLRNGVSAAMVMKICGWTELKTMQYYVRLAGVEIQGATDSLNYFTPEGTMGKVVELFGRSGA